MAEEAAATLETNPADAAPEMRSPLFNTMVEQLDKAMAEVRQQPAPAEKPADTRPVEQPALKREPAKQEKPAPKVDKPAEEKKESEPFVSPKAADWKKLKTERDEWQKKATEHENAVKAHTEKLAAIEKEYTEYKTKTAVNPEEVEALKKEREQYAAQLERLSLQDTPKFKQFYNAKFENAMNQALEAAGKEKADQVKALLEAPKSAWRKNVLNEIVTGMESEVDKINLLDAVNKYDATRTERDRELDNHKANLQEYRTHQQKEEQERQANQMINRKSILEKALREAGKFESFKAGEDAEHNEQVAKNRRLMEQFIMGSKELSDDVVAMFPALAMEGERLTRLMPKLVAEKDAKIAELEDALKKYQAAQPSMEGSGSPKGEQAEVGRPGSFKEQVMRGLASIGQQQ